MRNGNSKFSTTGTAHFLGSYPTYEEWKPKWNANIEKDFEKVLILPMRNGNHINRCRPNSHISLFLSYL